MEKRLSFAASPVLFASLLHNGGSIDEERLCSLMVRTHLNLGFTWIQLEIIILSEVRQKEKEAI